MNFLSIIVIAWAIYEIGRSEECIYWCEKQLRGLEADHARD